MLHRLLKQSGRGLAIAALTLLVATPLLAQTGRIEGTVRDANSDNPVSGARVTVVGTQLSAETNENGYYAIQDVPAGSYEVRVSVIGYQTVTITNQRVQGGLPTTVNFSLARSILRIEGVVVTGVAEATEAVKLPFTVDQVKAEDMPVPSSNPEEMIRGKVAGATVVRGSGRPGAGVSVLLRGATSINVSGRSNEPLYIVDGVILGASMVDIDALEIESMEIVKGAAASALYGARAANGVISIRTRRGAELPEGETRVTLRSEFGKNGMERRFPLSNATNYKSDGTNWLDASGAAITTADTTFNCDLRFASGGVACGAGERIPREIAITADNELDIQNGFDLRVTDSQVACKTTDAAGNAVGFDTDSDGDGTVDCLTNAYSVSNKPYPGTTYDHFDRFINPGTFYTNSIAVSHRTGSTNFLASISESKEPGVISGLEGYLRRGARLNVDHKIGQQLDFRASAYYSQSASDLTNDGFGGSANPFFTLVRLEPVYDLAERYPATQAKLDACAADATSDACLKAPGAAPGPPSARDSSDYIVFMPSVAEDNPLYISQNQDDDVRRGRFLGNFGMRWRPVDLVDVEADFSYDRSDRNTTSYWFKGYKTSEPSRLNEGRLQKSSAFTEAINARLTATLSHDFGDFGTVTKAQVLLERQRDESFNAQATGLLAADVEDLDNSNNSNAQDQLISSSSSEIRSLGYFLSTQWDVKDRYIIDALVRRDGSSLFGSDERWNWYYRLSGAYRMSEESWWPFDFLEEFKLRYSRGTAGNRPSFSAQYETYSVTSAGISKGVLGNRFLKPELATENEFGVDMIAGGRVSLSISRASTTVEDQILPVPLPGFAGFSSQWQNAGTIATNTWEATVQVAAIQSPDVSWSWNFVWDRTRGEVTDLNTPPFFLNAQNYIRKGSKLGDLWGDRWATQCSDLLFVNGAGEREFYSGDGCLGSGFEVNDDGYLVATGSASWTDGIDENWYGSQVTVDGVTYTFGRPIKSFGVIVDTLGFDASGNPFIQTDTTNFLPIGNTAPDFNVGVSQTFRYKGLSLYALVDASIGGDLYNQTRQWGCRDQTCWEYDQITQDGTLASGAAGAPANTQKELDYGTILYNVEADNSHYVESGSFVKLREVALRYTFGRGTLSGVLGGLMKRVSVSVIGRNLLTFTSYSGYDPEVSSQGSQSALLRIDDFGYPNFRTFTGQVEIEF